MSAALLNAARHIKLRLPALLHKDAKVKYLTTFDRFGKHVDCPQRRAYELVQNGVDQWRVQAKIQDDVSAQLEVSSLSAPPRPCVWLHDLTGHVHVQATPVETGFDVSFKGEKLGGVYVVDKMLILVNNKTQLPLAAFMHGYTQKEDTLTTGGQFGDGAKVRWTLRGCDAGGGDDPSLLHRLSWRPLPATSTRPVTTRGASA